MEKTDRLRLIAVRALRGYEDLSAPSRYELLLGLAEILPEAEAEAARHAAFLINEAELKQLQFRGLLGEEGGK